jgi:hypothetical protein
MRQALGRWPHLPKLVSVYFCLHSECRYIIVRPHMHEMNILWKHYSHVFQLLNTSQIFMTLDMTDSSESMLRKYGDLHLQVTTCTLETLPVHSDQFWGSPSLLSSGYWGLIPWEYSSHLVPVLRMYGAIPPLPHTSSWCAYLSKRCFFVAWCLVNHMDIFTFTFI